MYRLLIAILCTSLLVGCFWQQPSRPDDAVVSGVNYVGLTVADINRAEEFYSGVANVSKVDASEFASKPIFDMLAGRAGVKVATSLMRSSNAQIRLMQFEQPSAAAKAANNVKVYGPGIAHMAFQVAKTTNTYKRFLNAGGTHIGHPDIQLNTRTKVAYAYAYDLDNTIIEIEEIDVEALDLPEPPKNEYRIRHISLATPDIERAADFYATLLQVTNGRRAGPLTGEAAVNVTGEKGAEMEFAWFQVRNLELEIIQYVSHPTERAKMPRPVDASGFNMIVFDVTDMAALRARFVAAGGTIVLENKTLDGSDILFGRDLDGNLLGFQKLPQTSVLSAKNFADNGL